MGACTMNHNFYHLPYMFSFLLNLLRQIISSHSIEKRLVKDTMVHRIFYLIRWLTYLATFNSRMVSRNVVCSFEV